MFLLTSSEFGTDWQQTFVFLNWLLGIVTMPQRKIGDICPYKCVGEYNLFRVVVLSGLAAGKLKHIHQRIQESVFIRLS